MKNFEDFTKEVNQILLEEFNKELAGKTFSEGLNNVLTSACKTVVCGYSRFLFLENSLLNIKNGKENIKIYIENKDIIENLIKNIDKFISKFEKILEELIILLKKI